MSEWQSLGGIFTTPPCIVIYGHANTAGQDFSPDNLAAKTTGFYSP